MSIFNNRLSALYDNGGLSQTETVKQIRELTGIDIPQTTFSGYLKSSEPTATKLAAIAKFYNVSMEWLTGVVHDRKPVSYMLEKLNDLQFSDEVGTTAQLIEEMPKDQRNEVITMVRARHAQWQALNNLIETVKRFDSDGSISARIVELSGIDPRNLNSSSDLVGNDLFSDGDSHGRNKQVQINTG